MPSTRRKSLLKLRADPQRLFRVDASRSTHIMFVASHLVSRYSWKIKKILESQENLGKTRISWLCKKFLSLQEILDDRCEARKSWKIKKILERQKFLDFARNSCFCKKFLTTDVKLLCQNNLCCHGKCLSGTVHGLRVPPRAKKSLKKWSQILDFNSLNLF